MTIYHFGAFLQFLNEVILNDSELRWNMTILCHSTYVLYPFVRFNIKFIRLFHHTGTKTSPSSIDIILLETERIYTVIPS